MKIQEASYPGLSRKEAAEALHTWGKNKLAEPKKTSVFGLFAAQFKDFLTVVLLCSTVVTLFMGEYSEAITIGIIVFLNSTLGFLQEYRTEKTLETLKNMAAPKAKVFRDGILTELNSEELVPGDVVSLESGDKIPADGQLLSAAAFSSDESMLTGESVPVKKEKDSLIFSGAIVSSGHGVAKITATGMNTEMGKIANLIETVEESATPLQKRLDELGKWIAIGCLAICLGVALVGVLKGEEIFDMLMLGVSLAVAAVPEGLPAIVTVSLALAVSRMVKKRSLIKRLHAVEALGCADVICSDKTGTLTENRMTVEKLWISGEEITVSGKGYSASGGFFIDNKAVKLTHSEAGRRFLNCAVFCQNSAVSPQKNGELSTIGDPTETALLVCAYKAGVVANQSGVRRLREFPFDSDRKMMSVIIEENEQRFFYTKGSCEAILGRCKSIQLGDNIVNITNSIKKDVETTEQKMASEGLRVLALGYKPLFSEENDSEQGFIFLGLAAMIDPPRREAKDAVLACRKAGIRTVMITGDHAVTATAIAKMLSIYRKGDKVITGSNLEKMSDSELARQVENIAVFARVSPHHKLKIVRALKERGHIVAMTGDGINDAPAIKEADIGVSMGLSGTDVAKEAADVILLDDNFATLKAAVEEGRTIYRNIRKFMRYLLSCNIGEVLTMLLSILLDCPIVLLPIHILLVNLVTDGLPAIALGLEPSEKDVMQLPPRRPNESIFSNGLLSSILFRGCLIGLTTIGVFVSFWGSSSIETARTAALAALILSQLIHVFECKSETRTIFSIPFFNNKKLLGAVFISVAVLAAVIYYPPLQLIFQTTALSLLQLRKIAVYLLAAPLLSAILQKFWSLREKGNRQLHYPSKSGIIKEKT